MTTRHLLLFGGALLAVFALFFIAPQQVDSVASDLYEECAGVGGDRALCYETRVPALLDSMPLQDVFSVIRSIRAHDQSYQFCHVLAHKVGERIVAADPEKWIDAIPLNPSDGLCSNGFIHGVVGGKFRAEVLDDETLEAFLPDFSRACEPRAGWVPSLLDQAICYHGMGHLFLFITDADVMQALSVCERTSMSGSGDFRRVCREGVFMQIFQPLEPDDFLMLERMEVKPAKETVRAYCALFENGAYEGACLRESWPLFREELTSSPGEIVVFCSGQPNESEEKACFESMFSILGRQTLARPERAHAACEAVPEVRRVECYGRVALAFLEENRMEPGDGIGFCSRAPGEYARACLDFIAERALFIFGANRIALERFCRALPPSHQPVCRAEDTLHQSGFIQTGVVHIR